MASVEYVVISEEFAGQRIDNYLLRILKGVPKTRIYRLLRKGEVRVNGGRIGPSYRLATDDKIRVPPVRRAEAEPITPSVRITDRLDAAILYEDDRLMVLNKPSGLAVHGGSGLAYGVIEALRDSRPDLPFLDLAHRLDRDTSGCLVIAKRRSALRRLNEAFKNHTVVKEYIALLHGEVKWQKKTVTVALKAVAGPGGERTMQPDETGLSARTDFFREAIYPGCSLVRVRLHTGRMHQIRAHAQYLGHPVVMDRRYGNPSADKRFRNLRLRRLFLHASRIQFEIDGGPPVDVAAPLPNELLATQKGLSQ
ncbi:RluA family pseudouridine synthase [Spiribacter sp. C176]|uniref:Pseudouridine synthase n=1 Tax=Spiribacter salilacus TaxID=2664894 RepID=A0A6N7QLB5_9GAMM|nr:RluA family pseudouridine synthase [Spiribacter salilacus]MRH77285.1 RluA family pseudouridine synthase [Spiribacter salilacus]